MKKLILFAFSLLFTGVCGKVPKEDIPDPWLTDKSFIYDPEHYLTYEEKEKLNETIYKKIYTNVLPPCKNITGYEMRLILIDNMKYSWWSDKENVAKRYSVYLHDKFKVGNVKCRNGVLAFFALEDRAFFISMGKGMNKHLPNSYMENILQDVLPGIKSGNYYSSFNYMIRQMNKYMNNHDAENEEKVLYIILMVCLSLAGIAIFWCCVYPWLVYWVKYTYHYIKFRIVKYKVYRKLKKIDQDKEKIEKGNYITTTCPICLDEDLKQNEIEYTNCGHGFCKGCIKEHKKVSDTCPVCRKILSNPPSETGGSVKDAQLEELRTRLENMRRTYPDFISNSMVFDFGLPTTTRRSSCSNHDYFNRVRYRDYYQPVYMPIFNSNNNYHTFRTSSASTSFIGGGDSSGGYSSGGVGGSW